MGRERRGNIPKLWLAHATFASSVHPGSQHLAVRAGSRRERSYVSSGSVVSNLALPPATGQADRVADRVPAQRAAEYLCAYADAYRREHVLLTKAPPDGAGFPEIIASPYLSEHVISCLLARDGAAVVDFSWEPSYVWWLAGGPAMMVDYPDPDSRVPGEIIELLQREGIYGKPIGIYRICFREPVEDELGEEHCRLRPNA